MQHQQSLQARFSHQAPAFDSQAVRELLSAAKSAGPTQQVQALRQLAQLLEDEESAFRQLAGDPFAIPNQRAGFNIGKLLAVIKEHEDVYDRVADGWVMSPGATPEQQAVGTRFLLAVLTCWQFEYPLTEEAFVEDLQRWAAEYGDKTPAPGDDPPKDEAALLVEERSVYATGLLATALSNLDYVEAQVRGPLMMMVSKYLRRVVLPATAGTGGLEGLQGQGQGQKQRHQQQSADPTNGAGASISAAHSQQDQGMRQGEDVSTLASAGKNGISVLASNSAGASSNGEDRDAHGSDLSHRALKLRHARVRYCIQIVSRTGEFVESLGPVLQERGVEVVLTLLRHCCPPVSPHALALLGPPLPLLTHEVLEMLCALLAHRRFAEQFVEQGGAVQLLQLPRDVHTYSGLSQAFFGLATMPLAFERMCSKPIPGQLVSAALSLLGCGFDQARKRAAMFFAASVHYRAILEEFDLQQGPRRLLNTLRALVAQLRGTQLQDLRMERQVCFHCCLALQQWLRAHLALQVQRLRRGLSTAGSGQGAQDHAFYKPIDVSNDAMDSLISALEMDRRLAEAFSRARWPALESLVDLGGLPVLLELVQYSPQERWFHEITLSALEVLHLATLAPFTRRLVVGSLLSNQRPGMAVLLWAATPPSSAFLSHDPEMVASALRVVANCIAAPPSLTPLLSAAPGLANREHNGGPGPSFTPALWKVPGGSSPPPLPLTDGVAPPALDLGPSSQPSMSQALEQSYAYARQCLRANNGIRVLIQLLQPGGANGAMRRGGAAAGVASGSGGGRLGEVAGSSISGPASEKIRALAARGLLGLARDPHIRHILAKLQVGRLLAEMVRDPLTGCGPEPGRHASAVTAGPSTANSVGGLSITRGDSFSIGGAGVASTSSSALAAAAQVPRQAWHEVFNRAALELIALTATNAAVGRPDRVATAATDTAGTALHKIERAAIAAATPISYSPQELLLLVHEHLRASGLHTAAAALAKEAGLARVSARMASAAALLHTPLPPQQQQQQQQQVVAPATQTAQGQAQTEQGTAAVPAPAPGMATTPFPANRKAALDTTAFGSAMHPSTAATPGPPAAVLPAPAHTPVTHAKPLPTTVGPTSTTNRKKGLGFSANFMHAAHGGQAMPSPSSTAGTTVNGQGQVEAKVAEAATKSLPGSGSDHDMLFVPLHTLAGAGGACGTAAAVPTDGAADVLAPAQAPRQPAAAHERQQGAAPTVAVGTKRRASASAAAVPQPAPPLRQSAQARMGNGGGIGVQTSAAVPSGDDGALSAMHLEAAEGGIGAATDARAGALSSEALPSVFGGRHDGGYAAMPLQTPTMLAARPRAATAAAAAGTGTVPGAGVGAEGPAVNPLLLDLPCRRPTVAAGGGTGALSLGRRLSGTFTSLASTSSAAADTRAPTTAAATSASQQPQQPQQPVSRADSFNNVLSPNSTPAAPGSTPDPGPASSSQSSPPSPPPPPVLPPEPAEVPCYLEAAVREVRALAGPPAQSRLHSIVMSYLRHQHRQACMQAAAPTATLPPIPLSKPYSLPQASRALDAPMSCTRRLAERELGGAASGSGGERAQRQFVYSRFRQVQSIRDDSSVATCVAFVGGADIVAAGSHTGEIRMIDAAAGEVMDVIDAHSSGVVLLRSHDLDDSNTLLLSSSRQEVKLWPGMVMSRGPVVTWEQATRGRFNNAGTQISAVSCGGSPRQAYIYDVATHRRLCTLDEAAAVAGSPSQLRAERPSRGVLSTAWGPSDDLLLWGCTLWDLRMPKAIHQFDQFTEGASGCFHPRCSEVILNSEVWDLRTFKLLRSVLSLDNTLVTFSGAGDALYCIPRRPGDGELSLGYLHQRTRARHPLHTAFRTLDAATYAEIATVDVERSVLDIAVEPSDWMICLATLDVADAAAMSSSVRLYEVGRRKVTGGQGDSDDDEDDDGAEEEESEDEEGLESDLESLLASGSDDQGDTPANVRRRRVLAAAREAGAAAGAAAGRAARAAARIRNGVAGAGINGVGGDGGPMLQGDFGGSGSDVSFDPDEDGSLGDEDHDEEEMLLQYGLGADSDEDPYDPDLVLALDGEGHDGLEEGEELDVDAELQELEELEEQLMGEASDEEEGVENLGASSNSSSSSDSSSSESSASSSEDEDEDSEEAADMMEGSSDDDAGQGNGGGGAGSGDADEDGAQGRQEYGTGEAQGGRAAGRQRQRYRGVRVGRRRR